MSRDVLENLLTKLYGYSQRPVVDPASIPCIETSDSARLCRNPLVSVRLVTYNHEPYIRECIESVLDQQTDFEYELVIGEDCSSDKTREICFEYQKRCPEKVRVLWSSENVYKIDGNVIRSQYKCRGAYIALLEGDDYWADPLKLQKQIELIRQTKAIGCVANYQTRQRDGSFSACNYRCGVLLSRHDLFRYYPHTSTYVFRADALREVWIRYPDVLGRYDVILMHCLVEMGPVAHLDDIVSVYRLTGSGIASGLAVNDMALLSVRQYLDLYLHGPIRMRSRTASVLVTHIAAAIPFCRKNDACTLRVLRGIILNVVPFYLFAPRMLRAVWRVIKAQRKTM